VSSPFLLFPVSTKINSKNINQDSGLVKCRRPLNRIKKMTDLGQNVMKEERELTELSLYNSDNTADLDKAFE
jgi:hypothetical protein